MSECQEGRERLGQGGHVHGAHAALGVAPGSLGDPATPSQLVPTKPKHSLEP